MPRIPSKKNKMRPNLSHHVKPAVRGCRWSSIFLLFAFSLAFALPSTKLFAQAAAKPARASAPSNRFLFIIDTSDSMKKLVPDVLETVDDVLRTSASGQLHRGDTVGVWTFNTEVYSGNIPMQIWAQEDKEEIEMRTSEFLKQQHFAKGSRLDRALKDMYEVIKNSDIITVFIISTGQGKMQGSPFDDEINKIYKDDLKEMKQRRPIVTVLQAKAGKIEKFTVNAVPWPVVIPEVPIPVKVAKAAPSAAPPKTAMTNAPVAPAAVPPAVVQSTPPQASPVAATPNPTNVLAWPAPSVTPSPAEAAATLKDLNNKLKQLQPSPGVEATPAITPAAPTMAQHVPVPIPAPTIPPPSETPSASNPAPAPAKPTVAIEPPAVESLPPPKTITPVEPESKPVEVAEAKPSPKKMDGHSTNSLAAPAAMVAPPSAGGRSKGLLIGGVAFLVIALGLILVLVVRARSSSGPSLITHTMGNPRK